MPAANKATGSTILVGPDQDDARALLFGAGSPRTLPMKVIVCGLGRTGTASMQAALGILGIPAYHSFNLWQDSLANIRLWDRAFDAKYNTSQGAMMLSRNGFDAILGSYSAVVDVPGAFFGAELAALYPDAKVVILNRDPEAWFASCQATFTQRAQPLRQALLRLVTWWDPRVRALAANLDKKQAEVWRFEWHDEDAREKALAFFEGYYGECRARIAPGRRIEFTVQDGWAPLCEFLGVEVPSVVGEDGVRREVPFPRTNESASFAQTRQKFAGPILQQAKWDWLTRIGLVAAVGQAVFISRRVWLPVVMRVVQTGTAVLGGGSGAAFGRLK
ncbi:uncharacterized protein B0I36DRAFT_367849 [Microdochium trichocladiopsis]|uniref:P-loop containing nucleoside triphosphate hydrolase protein n=1 Tax=Microdochium trichocladiopsis TaxID=1682393 RepID=A0A9P8XXX1_9PEZI|nr:uncharacterized protein B0I36DRAFT_367849 [Microdochium trichocladiopsis]KAH7021437.1 hypothetical protein B0I36DRAFT_367849 [Microdochium trichocladiopsis]